MLVNLANGDFVAQFSSNIQPSLPTSLAPLTSTVAVAGVMLVRYFLHVVRLVCILLTLFDCGLRTANSQLLSHHQLSTLYLHEWTKHLL